MVIKRSSLLSYCLYNNPPQRMCSIYTKCNNTTLSLQFFLFLLCAIFLQELSSLEQEMTGKGNILYKGDVQNFDAILIHVYNIPSNVHSQIANYFKQVCTARQHTLY